MSANTLLVNEPHTVNKYPLLNIAIMSIFQNSYRAQEIQIDFTLNPVVLLIPRLIDGGRLKLQMVARKTLLQAFRAQQAACTDPLRACHTIGEAQAQLRFLLL